MTTKFDLRIAGLLEKTFQEKKPTCAWTGQRGGKHSVTFSSMAYQHSSGKQFTASRKQHGLNLIYTDFEHEIWHGYSACVPNVSINF